MADTATAERLTGYLVGGISPFGTKHDLPVVMEQSLLRFDKVAVNAGKRGVMLIMDPKDILLGVNGDILGLAKKKELRSRSRFTVHSRPSRSEDFFHNQPLTPLQKLVDETGNRELKTVNIYGVFGELNEYLRGKGA